MCGVLFPIACYRTGEIAHSVRIKDLNSTIDTFKSIKKKNNGIEELLSSLLEMFSNHKWTKSAFPTAHWEDKNVLVTFSTYNKKVLIEIYFDASSLANC